MVRPQSPIHDHVEVPLFADLNRPLPFTAFIEEWGITSEMLLALWQHKSLDGEGVLKLVQNWLFFGVLVEVLGLPPDLSRFKQENDEGRSVVYTKGLPRMCNEFRAQVPAWLEDEDRGRVRRIITEAQEIVDKLCAMNTWTLDRQKVVLSIILLFNLVRDFWDLEFASSLKGYLEFLESRMIDDGWCKTDIERFRYGLEPEKVYFLSMMDPPSPAADHRLCKGHRCSLNQMDWSKYKTKHTHEACNCAHVAASQDEMYSILRSDEIPLLLWSSETATLKIVSSSQYPKYVAISHVWSDRLGNLKANSLPQCQLERLQKSVNDLYEKQDTPIPLWIDTISCPRAPPESHTLAITAMKNTYRDADKVLVLDAYVERVEQRSMSVLEILLRIICSPWTRRLWTFQEGALARTLYFQFADGALDFDGTAARYGHWLTDVAGGKMKETCALLRGRAETVMIGGRLSDLVDYDFVKILGALSRVLRFRATSVASDEALCLGTLMGLDLKAIVNAASEDRMRIFWSIPERLTAAICLWNGPRLLNPPGFRWAPSGFLGNTRSGFGRDISRFDDVIAHRTPSGLVFESPCIFLHSWKRLLDYHFYLRDTDNRWLVVNFYPLEPPAQIDRDPPYKLSQSESIEFALIVQPPFEFDSANPGPPPQGDRAEAFLVSVENTVDGVHQARLEGTAYISLAHNPTVHQPRLPTDTLSSLLHSNEMRRKELNSNDPEAHVIELRKTSAANPEHSPSEDTGTANPPERRTEELPQEELTQPELQPLPNQLDEEEIDLKPRAKSGKGKEKEDSFTRLAVTQASPDESSSAEDPDIIKLLILSGGERTTSILSEESLIMFDGVGVAESQKWCID